MTNTIEIRTGSEGPRHDPYHFTEVTVEGRAGRVTYHSGLGDWTKLDGDLVDDVTGEAKIAFERLTGVTPDVAEQTYYKLKHRRTARHSCGTKHLRWQAGYPGEELLMCEKCGDVLDSTFDISAVI